MEKKRFRVTAPMIEIAVAVVIALLIWIFVGFSAQYLIEGKAGSCISVVFDKPFVKGADRIVVYENGQTVTISDKDTVRDIADLFMVANCTALCSPGSERRIEIYNGNRLVRNIRQTQCGSDMYYIYEADLFHWVLFEGYDGEVGLSHEQQQWLDGIIAQYLSTK